MIPYAYLQGIVCYSLALLATAAAAMLVAVAVRVALATVWALLTF